MKKLLIIVLLSFFTFTSALVSADADLTIDQIIEIKSSKYNLDSDLIRALIQQESGYKVKAVSNKDARGLMQVIPTTAERMGVNRKQLYIPERNIEAGTRYLSYLNKLFDGHLPYVLAAYNAGEGAVYKHKGIPPYRETQNYVPSVLARLNAIKARKGNPSDTSTARKTDLIAVSNAPKFNKPKTNLVNTSEHDLVYQAINNSSRVY